MTMIILTKLLLVRKGMLSCSLSLLFIRMNALFAVSIHVILSNTCINVLPNFLIAPLNPYGNPI